MIALRNLSHISSQRFIDSKTLFTKGRNSGAIYLAGYSIEFALKRKISQTLGFQHGFPETRNELAGYQNQINSFNAISSGISISSIKDIKNHNLENLLKYSGAELRVLSTHLSEWEVVKQWNPEKRYQIQRFSSNKVREFINSASAILKLL